MRLRLGRALLLLGLLAPFAAFAFWTRASSPLPYLDGCAPSAWIVHPLAPRTASRPAREVVVRFARELDLAAVPERARLRWRVLGEGELRIDDRLVGRSEGRVPVEADVTSMLRAGRNRLEVRVINATAPPALALALDLGGEVVETGASWRSTLAGAVWRPVRVAGDRPRPASPEARRWPPATASLVGIALIAAGVGLFRDARIRRALIASLPALVVVAWGIGLANSARLDPAFIGFDVEHHLEYVRFVLTGSLPLPVDGLLTYHPPLFYLLCAAALASFGLDTESASAGLLLRALSFGLGLAHVFGLAACARLLWPERRDAWGIALVFAACLPLHLALFRSLSNEALLAASSTWCVYLTLRCVRADEPTAGSYLAIGVVLGAALLTKLSAAVLVALAPAALALAHPRRLGRVAFTFVGTLAVCGWHYARLWSEYGTPIVGNWDPIVGFAWWQDPGFRLGADYLRFGSSLRDPWFAGFESVWDGLFSTLFADGLASGAGARLLGPAWSPGWMHVALLLGLVPGLAIAIGIARGLASAWRRPDATALFVTGLGVAMAAAVVYMTLRVPSYAQAKAAYASPALAVLVIAFVSGWEWIRARSKAVAAAFAVAFGAWALASNAAFFVAGDAPEALRSRAEKALAIGDAGGALRYAERAGERIAESGVAAEAREPWIETVRCRALAMRGERAEALAACRSALAVDGDDPDALFHTARLERAAGDPGRALELFERLARVAPQDVRAHTLRAELLARLGRFEEARVAASEWLRFDPANGRALELAGPGGDRD